MINRYVVITDLGGDYEYAGQSLTGEVIINLHWAYTYSGLGMMYLQKMGGISEEVLLNYCLTYCLLIAVHEYAHFDIRNYYGYFLPVNESG